MVFFLIEYLYSAFFLFIPHNLISHSNKAVQQALPLIDSHINVRAFIMILTKIKCNEGKVFKM